MTQSLIMAPFRRVRHSELTPVAPRGREQALAKVVQTEPAKIPASGGPKRAFSMTRLDQLARPRQRYLEEALRLRASVTKEPLVSPTRPTSSMSTATRIGTMTTTVPYRPLTSARKPRPLSMAMPSAAAPENMMTSSVILPGSSATIERPSRSALRAKLPFVTATDVRAQSAGSTRRQSVGTIAVDGKPTPPRKPSQVKAASAARRMVKQPPEVANDRLLIKSSSSCKLNTLTRSSTAVITSDNVQQQPHHHSHEIDRTRTMRKSATNPDAISAAAISTGKPLDSIAISQAPPTSNGTARSQPVQAITSTETLTTSQSIGDLVDIPERPNSESQTSAESEPNSTSTITPTITSARKEVSQEEYRRAMAEKRRLAREQAEREAEMERERIAKERAAEEERQRLLVERLREQEEQQRVEDERNRKLHEEYEDQQRKEAEEQQRLEEEAKARDEQERKNREKAEKARLELEERLRKDEEERIARKKVCQFFIVTQHISHSFHHHNLHLTEIGSDHESYS